MSGWIKLHRKFKSNSHFNMPDRALKIWLYILLSVSHRDRPAIGLKAGEAWISYDMIAEDCGEMGKAMRPAAIARELKWLEDNGYIRRFVIKGKGQKITVPNWDKYQATGDVTSESEAQAEEGAEVHPEVAVHTNSETEARAEVTPLDATSESEAQAEEKQEGKEQQEEREEDPPPTPPRGAASNGKPPVPVEEIVEHLNQRTGKRYRASSDTTKRHITARWREGFTLDDFVTVIDKKAAAWMGTDMEPYLRPQTLFGTKFEAYLNEPWPVRPRDAPSRAAPGESAVDRRLRELGVTFRAGA